MVKSTLRLLSHLGAALVALGIGAIVVAAIRLGLGPVSVSWMVPYIESALNESHKDVRFRLGDADITWLGWDHLVALRLTDIDATDDTERSIAYIPAVAVSFSSGALRQGIVAPRSVQIVHPNLWLLRGFDGRMRLAVTEDQETSEPMVASLLARLNEPDNPQSPLSYLDEIEVFDATLVYTDQKLGASWQARIDSADLRQTPQGVLLDARLATTAGGGTATVAIEGTYQPGADRLSATVTFGEVNLAQLAKSVRGSTPLSAFDLPLSGTVQGIFSLGGQLERADVALTATGGVVDPRPLFGTALDPKSAARLSVESVAGEAAYDATNRSLDLKRLDIAFTDGAAVALPAPLNHALPLKRLSAVVTASEARIDIQSLELDLDGPVIIATGRVDRPLDAPTVTLHAETGGVAFNDLGRYWPPSLAPGGHDWVIGHLFDGIARHAEIDLALAETDGAMAITSLGGRIEADGITVDYLPPLPAVKDAAGVATFDATKFDIEIKGGRSGDIAVTGGDVSIYDFDGAIERLDLDLALEGPLRDILNYINQPPLRFLEGFALAPDDAAGRVTLRLQLDLPLAKDLLIKEIDLSVIGEATDVAIENIAGDQGVRGGTLKLALDTDGMNIDGPITFSGIPGYLTWEESFEASPETRRQLRFTAVNVPVRDVHTLGEGTIDLAAYLIGGQISGDTTYAETGNGAQRFDVNLDLTNTDAAIPPLGWRKPAGSPGQLRLSGRLGDGALEVIDPIAFSALDLEARGRVDFAEGDVQEVTLRQLRGPLTDVSATARRDRTGRWRIDITGDQVNLPSLLAPGPGDETAEEAVSETDAAGDLPDLSLDGKIGRLWIGESVYLRDFATRLRVSDGRWEEFAATAIDNAGVAWRAGIAPESPQRRSLEVRIGDAGTVLRNLRIYEHVHGGKLTLNGTFDDSRPASRLVGRFKVADFRVTEAPALARLLNVASLTGIRNTLTGRGISFTELNAPFVMEDGRIEVKDARMYGSSLGLTAAGSIDTRRDLLDMRGTLVPFYTVNSVLGKIPLIGDVFSGGEKGGGVFAATYRVSGPVSDPDVSYNPLATLAPGFLRNLFNIFEEPNIIADE